jgi:seryl-tRNA synthetase
MRINEERMRLEIQHRKKHSPVKAVLGVAGVLVLIGGGIGYKMYSDHQAEKAALRAENERIEAAAKKAKLELEAALASLKKETESRLKDIKDENQRAIVRAEYEAKKAALEGRPAPRHTTTTTKTEPDKPTLKKPGGKRDISDNPLDGLGQL